MSEITKPMESILKQIDLEKLDCVEGLKKLSKVSEKLLYCQKRNDYISCTKLKNNPYFELI